MREWRRALPAIVAVAGVLLVVGASVDWSGVEYSSRLDRMLTAVAGLAALAGAGLGRWWRPRALVLAAAAGALGLDMAIVNMRDIAGHEFEYAAYPEATVGVGLHAALAGSLLALAGGLASLVPTRARAACT